MRFGEFVGNAPLKQQLSAEVDAGRFPQALVLEGETGSGKRTLAMQLARAAVCGAPAGTERPCGGCAACRKSVHPDIAVYGAEGQTITVDMVRQLRQEAYVLPNEAPCRVMLLLGAQSMTAQAQNALLKILEEPPALVRFILTCENRAQLLETVRSRCVCLTLQAVEWEEAAPLLRQRLPGVSEEQLRQAHSLFSGYIGQVIAGVGDGAFRQVVELTPQFARALCQPAEAELLRLTGRLEKQKELQTGVLAGLQLVLRDALAIRCGGTGLLSTAPQEAKRLAAALSGQRLMALAQAVEELQRNGRQNMNQTLFLTRMSACLRQAAGL